MKILFLFYKMKYNTHMEFVVNSLRETNKLAKKFAKILSGGEVILFHGDLGSGKTTFIKSVGKYLGIKEDITSPTFNIVKQYAGKKLNLYHLDLYRISDESELEMLGIGDILNDPNGVIMVEWAENAPNYFDYGKEVTVEKLGETSRKFTFEDIK